MRGFLVYVMFVAVILGLFGSSTVVGQCYSSVGAPPGTFLQKVGGPTIFAFGHSEAGISTWTGPGQYGQSGVLSPGLYELRTTGQVNGSACEQLITSHLQIDWGSPVSEVATDGRRILGANATTHLGSNHVGDSVSVAGPYNYSGSVSGIYGVGVCASTVTFGSVSLTVSTTGPLSAQTQMIIDGLGRASHSMCANLAGTADFLTLDRFTVSTPTNYSVTFTTYIESSGSGIPSGGTSQALPILPSSQVGPSWDFDQWPPMSPPGPWIDPPLAYGYTFTMISGDLFTKIMNFPVNIDGDGSFVVRVGNQTLGTYTVGQSVDFVQLTGAGVASFQVLGIDPLVDGDSPTSFPIQLVFDNPAPHFTMTPINMVPPVSYCFGDGSTTPCPCGNAGVTGNGCASSFNSSGANLSFDGVTSVIGDSLTLNATGTSDSSVLYFQGTTQIAATFGDGLRCAGGTVIRIGTSTASGGASHYPGTGGTPVSVKGAVPSGGGVTRNYQAWYRNAASFCTPSTFNLTNGLSVTWGI